MRAIACLMCVLMLSAPVAAQPVFRVSIAEGLTDGPVSGRLVVYLVDQASSIEAEPSAGPFISEPQPMLGVDVDRWQPGESVTLGEGATRFPVGGVPPGRYRAQAVLDRTRADSDWHREPGNLFTGIVSFTLTEDGSPTVNLRLDDTIEAPTDAPVGRVEFRAVESRLLSDARLERAVIRAGVIAPIDQDDDRRYPVVYEVPGFGGTHRSALRRAEMLADASPESTMGALARSVFWVVLDPEGPNGNHLFLDSRANGPVGEALVREVVPLIDSVYPTIPRGSARLLRGHSSGGWSAVHLALAYPETFGGAWASSPDPLDFRAFQDVNIYDDTNMYTDADGSPRPSYTGRDGMVRMTIAEENQIESVLGPVNTSAQQWDSWQAAFGPVDDEGRPARLYDETTGEIDPGIARRYKRADIADRIRRDPARLARLARDRVRVIVGDADEYDLDEGVRLFVETLGGFDFEGDRGWYAIVPGATHGTVLRSQASRRLAEDMLWHLREHAHAP